MEKLIKCPYCGKDSLYAPSNPSRPFCSDRCRLLDLGDWASEKYAVPGERIPDTPRDDEETSTDENDRED